jgi:choice-of-anchor B domain-containing protein
MNIPKRALPLFLLLLISVSASHDDTVGARYVQQDGTNASECLDHHTPCQNIQYALNLAQPGNTVKVAAGIYDVTGIDPESYLFGTIHAAGGYSPAERFHVRDPDVYKTILVGVDPKYRQAMGRLGFKWSADMASARSGIVDETPAPALQAVQTAAATCMQGFASQFPCRNIAFLSQIPLSSFSSRPTAAANVWGFVDLNDNREYAVIGLRNGTGVIDVTDAANPREVAVVPGNQSDWREVKIYQVRDEAANRYRAYAYISTEAPNSGVQVIDLSGLPSTVSLANTIRDTSSQHTLYVSNIDYGTNVVLPGREAFLYVAGSNLNLGSWRVYSLANPAQPQLITAAPVGTGYMHDSTSLYLTDSRTAQCDQGHNPCEVLVDFNETSVDLWDVTNKGAPVRLSSTNYPTAEYTHSGWPSADQRHIFIHDELEEVRRGLATRIYTMSLDNLRAPAIVTSYQGPTTTTDHNGYTKGNRYYVSHYRRGLMVFDVSTPTQLREIGTFDTFLAPAADSAGTDGAWGVYPFLPSGNVLISDITNGLFVLKDSTAALGASPGAVTFIGTTLTVSEANAGATVRLQRVGGHAGTVTVQYATADGSALAASDYTARTGTVTWEDGDTTEKTIAVTVTNDAQDEGTERFGVMLSNPGGGLVVEGSSSFEVTVTNDDAAVVPPPSGGGGGGGGSMELYTLLGALAALALRRRSVPRRGRQGVMDSPG